jgi:probable HAF family extracellular repeat protein
MWSTSARLVAVCVVAMTTVVRGSTVPYNIIDLGTLGNDTSSNANAINELGQVVGESRKEGATRAFLYDAQVMRGLGLTLAYDINDTGVIVGSAGRPAIHDAGGTRLIDTPGATRGQAWGVNNSGLVVGWYNDGPVGDNARAFVYDGSSIDTILGTTTYAFDVNDVGQVVTWRNASPTGIWQLRR